MIIGIGCDTVSHELTEKLGWRCNINILKRIFSKNELDLYHLVKKENFLTGRFAVKEAVLKSLGTGMEDGISLTDIETLQQQNGRPMLNVKGKVKEISDQLGVDRWHISITHESNYSIAFVIAESKNNDQ